MCHPRAAVIAPRALSPRAPLFLLLTAGLASACAASDGAFNILSEPKMSLREDAAGGEARSETSGEAEVLATPAAAADPASANAPAELSKLKGKEQKTPVATWRRASGTPNTSRLMVGDSEEIPFRGMQATVHIDGFRARVVLDCFFYNDKGRQLEGTFQLRLPDGASPYFLAFGEQEGKAQQPGAPMPGLTTERLAAISEARRIELRGPTERHSGVASRIREARVVPKATAALAYHTTVRRRVDPALMEWSGAGVFRTRVFPLLPGMLHHIVVGYDLDLTPAGDDLELRFDLPQGAERSALDVAVTPIPGLVVSTEPATAPGPKGLHFESREAASVRVRIGGAGAILLTGQDAVIGPHFAAAARVMLPEVATESAQSGVFLVDLSLSSNPEKLNVWLALMERILTLNRDALKSFGVLFFNVESFWWRDELTPNNAESIAALMRDAKALILEGATDLGAALREAGRPSWAQGADLFLLSDGAPTWGEASTAALAARIGERPLYAYSTGLGGTDTGVLAQLTRASGGAVFSVVGEGELEAAARAHRARPWRIVKVTAAGGCDLLIAGRPSVLYPNQRLLIVGRGVLEGPFRLELIRDGVTQRLDVACGARLESELARRCYGQVAVEQLEELEGLARETAKAYAIHYRVPGRTCSLLMLESEADYARFAIKPEEEAFIVGRELVSKVTQKALAERGASLGDAKLAFLDWLARIEGGPGFKVELSAGLKAAIAAMPRASFEVEARLMRARLRRREELPGRIEEQLTSRRLDFDDIFGEARRRADRGDKGGALRLLSSFVENKPGDPVLAREVAASAIEWGYPGQAFELLRRVIEARPFEPSTYLAAAQCLQEMGKGDLALVYTEVALRAQWDPRFTAFSQAIAAHAVSLFGRLARGELVTSVPDYVRLRRDQVRTSFQSLGVQGSSADLIVALTWNTDETDIDLHLTEPDGSECWYRVPMTGQGRLSGDVTTGYGPELYIAERARLGSYKIRVKYYAANWQRTSARTKATATIYERLGTKQERVTVRTAMLRGESEMHDVASFMVGP